jgi:hypothetical protein
MPETPTSFSSFGVPLGTHVVLPESGAQMSAAASREVGEREMAELRALNAPGEKQAVTPPALKAPVLPADFTEQLTNLDSAIGGRGVAVSREKLLALGQKRFQELLLLDRAARAEQRIVGTNCDLTSWPSVCSAFINVGGLNAGIPKRKTSEVWVGAGEDRERAGQFAGFADLWKSVSEPRAVRAICAFRDKFESLVFGMSMLDRIADDGKVRSKFFSGGKPAGAFTDWHSVLEQPHGVVTLVDSLGGLVCWLANERTPAPRPLEYAKELFGLRAPTAGQVKVAAAMWHAFVLGYTSPWDIWDFVGRETRVRTEPTVLELWRRDLAPRYPAIVGFHDALKAAFYKQISGHEFRFDESAHRRFVNGSIRNLSNRLSAIAALAVEEALPGAVVARFADAVFAAPTDRTRHTATLDAHILARVQAAFPRSDFQLRIEE